MLIGSVLIAVGLVSLALQRLYSFIPLRELKRLASRGDQLAARLYRVAAYGLSLRLLMWILVALSLPVGLLLVILHAPMLVSLIVLVLVAVAGFVVLPSMLLTQRSASFAAVCVPVISWLLRQTHPLLDRLARTASQMREVPRHSRLYEKEDLLDLLKRQKDQHDNRINDKDIQLVERALTFDDTRVADLVQPRKETHLVNADDSIGPILLDQLHKQKASSFLVYKDGKDNIVGSLAISDALSAKQGGRVFDLVRSDLIFVHEDFTARQVLTAFHKTSQQVAIVVNNAEEFIGVVTLDHLLKSLLGEAEDDGLAYGNRSQVAAYKPKPDKSQQETDAATEDESPNAAQPDAAPPTSSPEATEVVE
jgi:CBS domain containing-hemolysin-like protein